MRFQKYAPQPLNWTFERVKCRGIDIRFGIIICVTLEVIILLVNSNGTRGRNTFLNELAII